MSYQGWFFTIEWQSWGETRLLGHRIVEMEQAWWDKWVACEDGEEKENRIRCKWLMGDMEITAISEVEFSEEDLSLMVRAVLSMKQLALSD